MSEVPLQGRRTPTRARSSPTRLFLVPRRARSYKAPRRTRSYKAPRWARSARVAVPRWARRLPGETRGEVARRGRRAPWRTLCKVLGRPRILTVPPRFFAGPRWGRRRGVRREWRRRMPRDAVLRLAHHLSGQMRGGGHAAMAPTSGRAGGGRGRGRRRRWRGREPPRSWPRRDRRVLTVHHRVLTVHRRILTVRRRGGGRRSAWRRTRGSARRSRTWSALFCAPEGGVALVVEGV